MSANPAFSSDTRKRDHERNKLHKRLLRNTGQAITRYSMIEDGLRAAGPANDVARTRTN